MEKKKTIRKCVSCREHREKRDFLRIVRAEDGTVRIDFSQKSNGRGAYLCKSMDCFTKAKKQSALQRALKCELNDEFFDMIEQEINKDIEKE